MNIVSNMLNRVRSLLHLIFIPFLMLKNWISDWLSTGGDEDLRPRFSKTSSIPKKDEGAFLKEVKETINKAQEVVFTNWFKRWREDLEIQKQMDTYFDDMHTIQFRILNTEDGDIKVEDIEDVPALPELKSNITILTAGVKVPQIRNYVYFTDIPIDVSQVEEDYYAFAEFVDAFFKENVTPEEAEGWWDIEVPGHLTDTKLKEMFTEKSTKRGKGAKRP